MSKAPAVSVSTRTAEFKPRELPLRVPREQPRPLAPRANPRKERILDALRRWLEEEL